MRGGTKKLAYLFLIVTASLSARPVALPVDLGGLPVLCLAHLAREMLVLLFRVAPGADKGHRDEERPCARAVALAAPRAADLAVFGRVVEALVTFVCMQGMHDLLLHVATRKEPEEIKVPFDHLAGFTCMHVLGEVANAPNTDSHFPSLFYSQAPSKPYYSHFSARARPS